MTLKKIKSKISNLKKRINTLSLDAEAIITEHDSYSFEDVNVAEHWINSLPIESLYDSVAKERLLPRRTISSNDIKHQFKLRKNYFKLKDEIDLKINELRIEEINLTLEKIKCLEKKLC